METITLILFLLLAVVLSGIVSRAVPLPFPRPLFQIAFGAVIGLVADWRVALDPEVFFVLFLPPLLFLDGWRIPREDLLKDGKIILELALGLVVFTVLGMGFLIHGMIPAMPLAVAFALAAVISPTDPIAVSAIAQRVPFPRRMMRVLEGEALLNDSSGLVCLRYAMAAALTGTFSIRDAAVSFLWASAGGLAIGAGLTWGIARAKIWVVRHYGEDGGAQILISLLIPFGSYMVAEHLHCSGILAAVSAGLTMGFVETTGEIMASTRISRGTVWDTIQFTANGIIFVLLGEQLPGILKGAKDIVRYTGHHHASWLVLYVVAINLGLAGLRFLWVWLSIRWTLFRTGEWKRVPNWRIVAAMSFAGVRGAITLAGILTLPLAMNDGSPFPARDLAIFLAMGVIIISLLAASIGLPLVLHDLMPSSEPSHLAEENAARIAAAEAAIAVVEHLQHNMAKGQADADLYVEAASRIMSAYRQRIDSRQGDEADRDAVLKLDRIEREMQVAALHAERTEIYRRMRHHQLRSETGRRIVHELDLLETRYAG